MVEGNNGVGKSTVAAYLRDRLGAASFHYPQEFYRFRQQVDLDVNVGPAARLSYYLAATIHLADLVRGDLLRRHVVCDRYVAAPVSLLLAEDTLGEPEIARFLDPVEPYLCKPDLTLLVKAAHTTALERIRGRVGSSGDLTPVERHALASKAFFTRREAALRRYSARFGPLVELDTTEMPKDQMCEAAWSLVAEQVGFSR